MSISDPSSLLPVTSPTVLIDSPTQQIPADLLDDLPPFEQSSVNIKAVTRVVGNELARIEAARQDLILNFFPSTADALLHFFEQMLGLPADSPAMTLGDRRLAVVAYMRRLKFAGLGTEWENLMTSLIGTQWTYQEHIPGNPNSPAAYTVLIRLPYVLAASAPTGVVAAPTAGGTLAIGTYYYAVTAKTAYGETSTSAVVSATRSTVGSVTVSWSTLPPPITGYNIYRGTTPTALRLIGSTTNLSTFVDNGSATPGGPPPATDSSGSLRAALALALARTVTPANLVIDVGYTAGFIIGVSQIGVDAL